MARIDRRTRLIETEIERNFAPYFVAARSLWNRRSWFSAPISLSTFSRASGQSLWSVLPLNAVLERPDFCPYNPISAFATNSLLISPEKLLERGFLEPG